MASDPVSFDVPVFAEHDFSPHCFPKGMIETFVDHYRHHTPACSCIAMYKKSYRKEENNGVTWGALRKAIGLALYEPIKPEIFEMASKGVKPLQIAEGMARKYNIPYKRPRIAQILLEANHHDNVALSGHMAATPQSLDQQLIPNTAATPRAEFPAGNMEWDPSGFSFFEGPDFELPMHVGNVLNRAHEENEVSALKEQVRELETRVSNQHNKIAELEIQVDSKARKVTELEEENRKLHDNAVQLKVYQQLMEKYHRFWQN